MDEAGQDCASSSGICGLRRPAGTAKRQRQFQNGGGAARSARTVASTISAASATAFAGGANDCTEAMMSRVRCSCGRMYDPGKNATCPDCGAESPVESIVVAEKAKPPSPPPLISESESKAEALE